MWQPCAVESRLEGFGNKVRFWLRYVHFKNIMLWHSIDHSVNVSIMCSGKPKKIHRTCLISVFALLGRSGTEPSESLRSAHILVISKPQHSAQGHRVGIAKFLDGTRKGT